MEWVGCLEGVHAVLGSGQCLIKLIMRIQSEDSLQEDSLQQQLQLRGTELKKTDQVSVGA